jgi:hypothetical protein
MIIQTSRISRTGGVAYLARHLFDKTTENELIEVLGGDRSALHDAQALAEVKRCKFAVRHLSISPGRPMSPAQLSAFIRSVDQEFGVGPDRPRLIVRHIKDGRAHFHFAVAEVDPVTLRVLDCRNDYRRLEDLARRYEADHGENIQPTRAERREVRVEGFSDVARKRAERTSPGFDRSGLKRAFADGTATFLAEVKTQGLHIEAGSKGPILVTSDGTFVASATRAAGVRRNEFLKFMEMMRDDRLIGSQTPALGTAGDGRTQHDEAAAASRSARNPGRTRPSRPDARPAASHPRHAAADGDGTQWRLGQGRSSLPAIAGRRSEDFMLARVSKELDNILRRARKLAEWIASLFESEADRLTRRIAETRKWKSFPPPAAATAPNTPTYDLRRRMLR